VSELGRPSSNLPKKYLNSSQQVGFLQRFPFTIANVVESLPKKREKHEKKEEERTIRYISLFMNGNITNYSR